MKEKIIIFLTGLISGVIIGGFLVYNITKKSPGDVKEKITTEQLEGEKIKHSDFNITDDSVEFITEAEGKGKAKITIDTTIIPEIDYWKNKKHSIGASIYYQYHNELFPSYGINYSYRWESLQFNAGIIFSERSIGIQAGVQYWFKI